MLPYISGVCGSILVVLLCPAFVRIVLSCLYVNVCGCGHRQTMPDGVDECNGGAGCRYRQTMSTVWTNAAVVALWLVACWTFAADSCADSELPNAA